MWYLTYNMSNTELPRLSTLALRRRKARLLQFLQWPADAIHASFLERFLKCDGPIATAAKGKSTARSSI